MDSRIEDTLSKFTEDMKMCDAVNTLGRKDGSTGTWTGWRGHLMLVEHWHKLLREAVAAPSLEGFEARLDEAWSNLV
ncbi:hypothetical protein WISP_118329 [Willisornis vidua]|uniref:Uncharacterized protein n=1 Tax=Willisornis vidua TaxID=1566151 RepID=A0ABQ9CZ89_9PASS|nr:hypothetical protein WISP_118329 [Willisornis vidua]